MAISANKIKGIRAAVFYNGPMEIIKLSREHNNANILSLGARFMKEKEIFNVIEVVPKRLHVWIDLLLGSSGGDRNPQFG